MKYLSERINARNRSRRSKGMLAAFHMDQRWQIDLK